MQTGIDQKMLKLAWAQLREQGTASQTAANILRVGITSFLDGFKARYLGPEGIGQGLKLILGQNGEGKTHLLMCVREVALQSGHVAALIEPKTAPVGDSSLDFAREILRKLEVPAEFVRENNDELRVIQLLRAAVHKKRAAAEAQKLDPERILPHWAEGLRGKDLHPSGWAEALADGLEAVIEGDEPGLRKAAARVTLEGVRGSKKQQELDGAALLRSIPLAVKFLGFLPPVILLDEAETAVKQRGSARLQEFLKFLRFLNDYVAHSNDERAGAIVVIGCTDEFWPDKFQNYEALHGRLKDAGYDALADRRELTINARILMNKLWVSETFQGEEADYEALGKAMLDLAVRLHPDVEREMQLANARQLARVASSNKVRKQVKRNFVKAFAGVIDRQIIEGKQRALDEVEAGKVLDNVVQEILSEDAE